MFVRKSFARFLAVQSEATPAAAEGPRDCVLDWRWFEEEPVMPAVGRAPIWLEQAVMES